MVYTLTGIALAAGLLIGMVLCEEIGRRIALKRLQEDHDDKRAGLGVVEGAVFGLFGLLVAFTFSGAAARFDTRRQLIVEEANIIGTAWLRLDLLPPDAQPPLRELFRRYVDTRQGMMKLLPDIEAAKQQYLEAGKLHDEIWRQAVAACQTGNNPATTSLVLQSLNEMIDITQTRYMAAQFHPPLIVFGMLFGLGLGCSLMVGHAMAGGKSRNWLHAVGFALVIAVTVYVIIDIEFPRVGLIRIDMFDQVFDKLRQSMG